MRGRNPAFERQMEKLLSSVDAAEARATFFVLGLTAENHPYIVDEILSRGHEIGCHGYAHDRVYGLTREEFRQDLERSLAILERLGAQRPIGYRAPCFSINRESLWARDVLAELGFQYDSSECACPWVPRSLVPPSMIPRLIAHDRLWELPVASIRIGTKSVPVGGASYWRWIPSATLVRALRSLTVPGSFPALYVHPYECDPARLSASPPSSVSRTGRVVLGCRAAWRNAARGRVLERFVDVAANFELLSCEEALRRVTRNDSAT